MQPMRRTTRFIPYVILLAFGVLAMSFALSASAQPAEPQAVDLPCTENVSVQALGKASPSAADGQALVLTRVIIEPGGSIRPHTHPGTLVAVVESGRFGFTLIDHGEMSITRAGSTADDATEEALTPGQEVELGAGDWFVETGMVHSARAIGDEPVSVLISGLIEAGEPLTKCADQSQTSGRHI